MKKRTVIKFIDYVFQHKNQLVGASDDSNSTKGLTKYFDMVVVGRTYNRDVEYFKFDGTKIFFLPSSWDKLTVSRFLSDRFDPDVLHLHGNHSWPNLSFYADFFKNLNCRLIFSPAGSSCGTPEFLSKFDVIIVNHKLQVDRMKCYSKDKIKIMIRRRAVNLDCFHPAYSPISTFCMIYIAGFVPVKNIPMMIDYAVDSGESLIVLGDFTRTKSHHEEVLNILKSDKERYKNIFLHDFIAQSNLPFFLGHGKVFVWPNIKPENPSTTTNRSVVEALGCGMPLLLGERAFKETEFVIDGYNGFLFSDKQSFKEKLKIILDNLDTFRKNSFELAKERFSWKKNFVDFYFNVYRV